MLNSHPAQNDADLAISTLHYFGTIMAIMSTFFISLGMYDIIPLEFTNYWAVETLKESYQSIFSMLPNLAK